MNFQFDDWLVVGYLKRIGSRHWKQQDALNNNKNHIVYDFVEKSELLLSEL